MSYSRPKNTVNDDDRSLNDLSEQLFETKINEPRHTEDKKIDELATALATQWKPNDVNHPKHSADASSWRNNQVAEKK